jgi:hypothetical protein
VKPTQEDGFKEVRRRKRHSTNEAAPTSKKPAAEEKNTPNKEVATRNFFAPLRGSRMDTDSSVTEATTREEAVPSTAGRPPPIILTANANLIQLQRQLKNVAKGDFEFRNTKGGTRVITRSMTDFDAVKSYFSTQNLSYYSFWPLPSKGCLLLNYSVMLQYTCNIVKKMDTIIPLVSEPAMTKSLYWQKIKQL